MPKGTDYAGEYLNLTFRNEAIPNVGDAAGIQPAAAAGNIYLVPHTASPGVGGDATTNASTLTGVTRFAAPRNSSTWSDGEVADADIGGNAAPIGTLRNLIEISFTVDPSEVGSDTITHLSAVKEASGASRILYISDPLPTPRLIDGGTTLVFPVGSVSFSES